MEQNKEINKKDNISTNNLTPNKISTVKQVSPCQEIPEQDNDC